MEKLMKRLMVVLGFIAFGATHDAQAMQLLRKFQGKRVQEQESEEQNCEGKEQEENQPAGRTVKIQSLEDLLGYTERRNELACIEAIRTNKYREVRRLLEVYGDWRPESHHWLSEDLIRPQILIEAHTIEMFRVMINAGIDPKNICQSGPDQYYGKSLVEIVKMRLGDKNPDFKSLVNYMLDKKLFRGFENPKAYFAAMQELHDQNKQLEQGRMQQELEQEQAKRSRVSHRKQMDHAIHMPAPIEQPAVMAEQELDFDEMARWRAHVGDPEREGEAWRIYKDGTFAV